MPQGYWRRNLNSAKRRSRSKRHKRFSASVDFFLSWRAKPRAAAVRVRCLPSRPLTLALSPDGGEGTSSASLSLLMSCSWDRVCMLSREGFASPSPRLRRRDALRIGAGHLRTFAPQHRADSTTFLLPVEAEFDRLDLKWMQIKLHGVGLNLELRPGIFQQVRLVGSSDPGSQFDLYCRGCLASGFINSKYGGVPRTRFQSRQHHVVVRDFQQSPAARQKAGVRRDFAREQRMIELQRGA